MAWNWERFLDENESQRLLVTRIDHVGNPRLASYYSISFAIGVYRLLSPLNTQDCLVLSDEAGAACLHITDKANNRARWLHTEETKDTTVG